MWVLAVNDRSYWLVPGKPYTIGRSGKAPGSSVDIVVKESSVSRQHCTIEVRPLAVDNAVTHPSVRSEVFITDLESRFGTFLGGEKLSSGTATQIPAVGSGKSVTLKVGTVAKLRLYWQPLVITYTTGQTGEPHEALWRHAVGIVEPLDVKLVPHIVQSTTILVKTGSSTSSLYFALARQIPVANIHYFEALRDAASKAATTGVSTLRSLVPDPLPFSPDPKWIPNQKRESILKGKLFSLPSADQEAALRPIIEAAGGSCKPPSSPSSSGDAIVVYKSESLAAQATVGTRYILNSAIFSAIDDVVPISDESVRRTAPSALKRTANDIPVSHKSKRSRLNVFDIMTSQPSGSQVTRSDAGPPGTLRTTEPAKIIEPATVDTMGSPPSPPVRTKLVRRLRKNALDIMTSQDPGSDQTARHNEAISLRQRPLPQPFLPPTREGSSRTTKMPKRTDTTKIPIEVKESSAQPRAQDVSSPQEEDHEVLDYDPNVELAVVENTLQTNRPVLQPALLSDLPTAGKPNFKAFKRKKALEHAVTSTVGYDTGARDAMHPDDIFAMQTRSLMAPGGENEEESLFVHDYDSVTKDTSTITMSMANADPSENQPERNRGILSEVTPSNDVNDEFGFQFT